MQMDFIPPEFFGYRPPPTPYHFVQPWAAGYSGSRRQISDLNPNSPRYGGNAGNARAVRSSYGNVTPRANSGRRSKSPPNVNDFRSTLLSLITGQLDGMRKPRQGRPAMQTPPMPPLPRPSALPQQAPIDDSVLRDMIREHLERQNPYMMLRSQMPAMQGQQAPMIPRAPAQSAYGRLPGTSPFAS